MSWALERKALAVLTSSTPLKSESANLISSSATPASVIPLLSLRSLPVTSPIFSPSPATRADFNSAAVLLYSSQNLLIPEFLKASSTLLALPIVLSKAYLVAI